MIKVQDIAYVRLAAPDLAVMQRFAADFGLALTARESDTLYHRGSDPSPYLHVTELGEPGFRGVAFETASADDLAKASKLEGASPIEKIEAPGGGQVVRFTDPDGYRVEVVHGRELLAPLPVPTSSGVNRALSACAWGISTGRRRALRRSNAWVMWCCGCPTSGAVKHGTSHASVSCPRMRSISANPTTSSPLSCVATAGMSLPIITRSCVWALASRASTMLPSRWRTWMR